MNQYPLWKNLLILAVVLFGLVLALPNLFPQDPAIEVRAVEGEVGSATRAEIAAAMENAGVAVKAIEEREGGTALIRFETPDAQLRGQATLDRTLGEDYQHALTQSPDLPGWIEALGLQPMFLGLDLRGGIHVLIDVDMDAAVTQALERFTGDIRTLLRNERIRYLTVGHEDGQIEVRFREASARDEAATLIRREFRDLEVTTGSQGGDFYVYGSLPPAKQEEVKRFALEQNITTLRNRVNALGVAEPIIQRQGERRIIVQLPGAQDPARLKDLLGATATLEYRLVDTEHDVQDALDGRVPVGAALYRERNGQPILLKRRVIVTGDQITSAAAGFDQQSGSPMVSVSLDGQGARQMRRVTTENVGKPMAVVFIE
ncbi:MAG: SecDF P1 head subdomain-containing protein, partial [Halochromatium sp.]